VLVLYEVERNPMYTLVFGHLPVTYLKTKNLRRQNKRRENRRTEEMKDVWPSKRWHPTTHFTALHYTFSCSLMCM